MAYTTLNKLKNYARSIEIQDGALTATLNSSDANDFLSDADTIIDSKLSTVYFTPLRQITRGGVTYYPNPIPVIATKIAAYLAIRSVHSRIEPRKSEAAESNYNDAINELDRLADGEYVGTRRLEGQTMRAKNYFINPYIAPHIPRQQGSGPV